MKAKKDMFKAPTDQAGGIRINKFLADSGVCSRREADSAVEAGLVTIDGQPALMGSKVLPGQTVAFKGKEIARNEDLILIAFNKPRGIVCTTDRRDPDNIIDFISYSKRIFPIGRLDKDSEGLILLTNDGNIVNKILRAGNYHEKEYIVKVNKEITPEFLERMGSGVPILDTVTRPCRIEQIDKFTFRIILTQGLNRQIRRMCEALDYRVRSLARVRIMNISLGRLKTGTYRNVTEQELAGLKELIANSSNAPVEYEGDEEENLSTHRHEERSVKKTVRPALKATDRVRSTKKPENTHEYRREKTTDHRTDRASFQGRKGVRTGRQGDHK
jgi:23S rRNA pseudouridine2604 synthase